MNSKLFRTPAARRLAVALIATMLGGFITHAAVACYRSQRTEDFAYFYRAARAMLAGDDIYAAAAGRYIYPPFLAFVFQPLALLPEVPAATLWAVLSGGALLAALLIAAQEAAKRWLPEEESFASLRWVIAAAAMLLLADKMHAMFTLGQTDSLMLLGFACAFRWLNPRPLLAGLTIGAAANIKYLSLICVPYFILKRNVRAAAAALLGFMFFLALPLPEIGLPKLGGYTAIAFGGLARMMGFAVPNAGAKVLKVDWEKSLSWTSAAFRITRSHGLPDSVAIVLVVLLLFAAVGAIWLVARLNGGAIFELRRNEETRVGRAISSLEWAALIFLALVFSPQTTSRHMILLAVPLTIAVALLLRAERRADKVVLVGAMGLMLAGLSLPLGTLGFEDALRFWRVISGASWCAFLLTLAIVWCGSRAINDLRSSDSRNVDSG